MNKTMYMMSTYPIQNTVKNPALKTFNFGHTDILKMNFINIQIFKIKIDRQMKWHNANFSST